MNTSLRVLFIEDSKIDVAIVLDALTQGGYTPISERVETPEAFKESLANQTWDIILSDYRMPRFNALAALQILQESGLDIPFIIISGSIGEEIAVQALKKGANDYLMKDNLTRLVSVVERELREAEERSAFKKAEKELQKANATKENLMATLTHDLKTPIRAEHRILQLFKQGDFGPLTQDQDQILQEMILSNRYMAHLVDNMMGTYSYEDGDVVLKLELTDINQLITSQIANVFTYMAKEKGLTLQLNLSENLSAIEVDPFEIQRVLNNLIQNAILFTESGGSVTVATNQTEDVTLISIADTGKGIKPDLLNHLFDKYKTETKRLKHVGTGLGLYLSKKIIDAHKGQIDVKSEEGKGSTFTVKLPRHPKLRR